jgi:hypothetical protein
MVATVVAKYLTYGMFEQDRTAAKSRDMKIILNLKAHKFLKQTR